MTKSGEVKAVISEKPYSVPIELRPLWRISLILNSIAIVSKDKGYLDVRKINILVWMLIRKTRWDEYQAFLTGRSRDIPLVSVDTATYKAVEFAIAKEFVRLESGRLYLNQAGHEVVSILEENNFMTDEAEFLSIYGRKLTDGKIKELTGGLL